MANTNERKVQARLDEALWQMKKQDETVSEFVNRAMLSLREKARIQPVSNIEHKIFIEMCKVFIKQHIMINLARDEGEYLKHVIETEVVKK
jgi:hypothetical protein